MLIALLQTALAAIACYLLFALWRFVSPDRTLSNLVGAGLILRALSGQVLFWISYLRLPILLPLQEGRGFWFYGSDGRVFFDQATTIADRGFAAIFTLDASSMSPAFTNLLAMIRMLFGPVASTVLLLNLAAYLGTCAIVVRLARPERAAAISIAAISFSPASILWSTQPLKDTFLVFLIASFLLSVAAWMSVWRRKESRIGRAVMLAMEMLIVLCAIAGIRWYVALLLLVLSAPLSLLEALRAGRLIPSLAILVLLTGLVLAGAVRLAGPFIPSELRGLITSPTPETILRSPKILIDILTGTRTSFDMTSGSTTIQPGALSSRIANKPAARFVSGLSAFLLPRSVAQGLGLIQIQGGRGLWLFADADTLYFDFFVVIAIGAIARALRSNWRTPLLWLIVAWTLIIAGSFVFSVANFGALFRYRSMVFLGVALIPVAAAWRTEIESAATESLPTVPAAS